MKFLHAVLLAALACTGNAMAMQPGTVVAAGASHTSLQGTYMASEVIPGASAYLRVVLGWESGSSWEEFNAQLSSNVDLPPGLSIEAPLGERAPNSLPYFEAHAGAVAYPALAVPEAPTVAMLFAGLGVLLLRIRHAQHEA